MKRKDACKHLIGAEPDKAGRAFMKKRAYKCGHPLPEKPDLPACFLIPWPPHAMAVWKRDCEECKFFTATEPNGGDHEAD